MKFILKVTALSLISILTIGIQTSYADCMRISGASCQLKPNTDPSTVVRVGSMVKHAGNSTNTIGLLCPLNLHGIKSQSIKVLHLYTEDKLPFRDEADPKVQGNVLAQIRSVNHKGNIGTLVDIQSFDDPLSMPGSTANAQGYFRSRKENLSATMDFTMDRNKPHSGAFYYVDVSIKRPNTQMHPAFVGIGFCGGTARD